MAKKKPPVKTLSPALKQEIEEALADEPLWIKKLTIADWTRYINDQLVSHYNGADIAVPRLEDMDVLSASAPETRSEWSRAGEDALLKGQVAVYLGEAGQATGFGECTKAVVEVREEKTFHELKLDDVRRIQEIYGRKIPVFKLVSAETARDISALEKKKKLLDGLFVQNIVQHRTLRAEPDNGGLKIARRASGEIEYAMGGHWFIFPEFREQALQKARDKHVKYVLFMNIDNLGATIDPLLIGYHIWKKNQMTMEVAEKHHGDKGGAGARIKGVFSLLEGPRVPPEWKEKFEGTEFFKYFNTNTFILSLSAFQCRKVPEVLVSSKNIDGRPRLIFERISGEMMQFLKSSIIATDRNVRFNPSKFISDLWLQRSDWCELRDGRVVPARDGTGHYVKKPLLKIGRHILNSVTDLEERVAGGGRNTSLKHVKHLYIGGVGHHFDDHGDVRIGNNVTFKGKVEVVFEGPNADLIISDNVVLEDQKIVIPEGEHKII
jgi:UTP--glucose-1-phosphate uridylyltransferase